jgi:hypothetical protein
MSVKSISYKGSAGNIREIYPTGRPERPYKAVFRGGTLGYYPDAESAERAIQDALRAHLDRSKANG